MDSSELTPGDQVLWFKVTKGYSYMYQKVPAVVFYRSKGNKVAIKIKDPSGNELVRLVDPANLERATRGDRE